MSVASTSSFSSVTSSAGKAADLEKKAATRLAEKMRKATEDKAEKAAIKEAAKASAAAEKEAKKAAKEEEKAIKKAEKEAIAAAAKAAKAAEKDAAKAAKEAEEASKPKRAPGRPRKEGAAGGAGSSTSSVSSFGEMREPLPAITPKMRSRIAAADHPALEIHPALFAPATEASTDPEELAAENARLRGQLAALMEAYNRQRAAISHTVEVLSGCHLTA